VNRYARQVAFAGIGAGGQERLRAARVVVVGCGALGSSIAETMVRAGVGTLDIVDRDVTEEQNLQRQALFDEEDVALGRAKATAAARHLRRINGDVEVRSHVLDVTPANVRTVVKGADLVLDGCDNFETRFALNEACIEAGAPWVFGSCVASYGMVLSVQPRKTPCLACVLDRLPAPGSAPTCEAAGIIAPIARIVAGLQSAEGLKLLTGQTQALLPGLVLVDVWKGVFEVVDMRGRTPCCAVCREGRYDTLSGAVPFTTVLCGREAVHLRPASKAAVSLPTIARRLRDQGRVTSNDDLVRFTTDDTDLVVFADGRAIVRGVSDPARARSIYARWIGS